MRRPLLHSRVSRSRGRSRGTSLIEILVVIVVFLVGILAVAQIFPQGFRVLAQTRARSLASTLARAESERLKARPDLLPEEILPIRYVNNAGTISAVTDETKGPREFAPTAAGIDLAGNAIDAGGTVLGDWSRLAGANSIRRIQGEAHTVAAPRFLYPTPDSSAPFGGLVSLQYGPMDFDPTNAVSLSVYGRDMERRVGPALSATPSPADLPREYEYLVSNDDQPTAQITFPARNDATYNLSLTVYFNTGGVIVRRDIKDLPPISVATQPSGFAVYPLANASIVPSGSTLVGVDVDSIRVARNFARLSAATPFSTTDPYQYKLVTGNFGFLLFNPLGYNLFEQRPGQGRTPFVARVNYDVYDWRILREDFRVPRQDAYRDAGDANGATTDRVQPASLRLAVTPIRTTTDVRADSLPSNGGIEGLLNPGAGYDARVTSDPADSYFILLDLETGGIYYEAYNGKRLIDVNKSSGRVSFLPYNATGSLTGWLYLPDGRTVQTPIEGRAVRALYVARDEWAVQVLRAPARYTLFVPTSGTPRPTAGTYYLGGYDPNAVGLGGSTTRIYFPFMDKGRKVSLTRVAYLAGTTARVAEAVDAVLRTESGDATGLPFLDLKDVDSGATGFDYSVGNPASGVRGASAAVRVFHNEFKFRLGSDTTDNLNTQFQKYLRTWKVDTKETYLTDGGL